MLPYCSNIKALYPLSANRDWPPTIATHANTSSSVSYRRNWGSRDIVVVVVVFVVVVLVLGSSTTSLMVVIIEGALLGHKPLHTHYPFQPLVAMFWGWIWERKTGNW